MEDASSKSCGGNGIRRDVAGLGQAGWGRQRRALDDREVDHGGFDAGVAEEVLDGADVSGGNADDPSAGMADGGGMQGVSHVL